MFFFASLLLFSALASRALAVFTVTVNNVNLTTSQLFDVPDGVVKTTCFPNCNNANQSLQACGDDFNCLCGADRVASLLNCEQCMYNKTVEINQKTDVRVGPQAVMSGYATACNNTVILAASQTALTLPPTWDGSFEAVLPIGGVVVVIGSTVVLGISALFILSNL